jgi:hypothetical protein
MKQYFSYILESFRKAYWDSGQKMTLAEMDYKLRFSYPLMFSEKWNGTKWTAELRDIQTFTKDDWDLYLEFLHEEAKKLNFTL